MTQQTDRELIQHLVNELQGYRVAHPDHEMPALEAGRTRLAQPEPEGDGLFHWRNLGDGKPVQVRECPMCGIAPANVDDCGRFGDPACPYFGVGEPEPEGVTDEEILALAESHEISYNAEYGRVEYPFVEGHDMRDELLSYSRALIARSLELLPDDTTP